MFHLAVDRPDALTATLHAHGVLAGRAVTRLAPAGAGNMNLTLRAWLAGDAAPATVVVKQARPWVEKYPTIAAPADRDAVEAAFYAAVGPHPAVAAGMPALLAHLPDAHLLVLEDLGHAADFTDLYAGARLEDATLDALRGWLARLHALDVAPRPTLANRAMRALNHAHVFDLPFREPHPVDLDALTPGLGDVASALAADADTVRRIHRLGDRYLDDGPTLLHGDFYPGSWLRTPDGVRVIDPEFGFLGPAAFDHGVLAAHLLLTGHETAADQILAEVDALARGFAGTEVLRRLLGVAQLPLDATLDRKAAWIDVGLAWVRDAG